MKKYRKQLENLSKERKKLKEDLEEHWKKCESGEYDSESYEENVKSFIVRKIQLDFETKKVLRNFETELLEFEKKYKQLDDKMDALEKNLTGTF